MERGEPPPAGAFGVRPRRTVRLSQQELVRVRPLDRSGDRPFLLEVEPAAEGVDLVAWIEAQRGLVEEKLFEHGALFFRGFAVATAEQFQGAAKAAFAELLDYRERAAPRHEVSANVYTSTEFPPDQRIPLHHEMSYSHNWPAKLAFFCVEPAPEGGRTPLADDRRVIHLLDPEVKRPLLERRVMYVRNFGGGVDFAWQEAFQTSSRERVEEYCRRAHMEVEWLGGDRLRTRAVRQVTAAHPRSGETVWFNHAHLFHSSSLDPAVREALLAQFAPDELPRNALYGDGSPIEDAVVEHVREVYERAAVRFTWQVGDVLLIDNFLVSHGRERFRGPRRILVSMGELYTAPELREAGAETATQESFAV